MVIYYQNHYGIVIILPRRYILFVILIVILIVTIFLIVLVILFASSIGNNSLQTAASPLLHEMMFNVHKKVPDPYRDETVFDRCMIEYKDKNHNKTHAIFYLRASSDYFAFSEFMGIPSIDMGYRQTDLVKLKINF